MQTMLVWVWILLGFVSGRLWYKGILATFSRTLKPTLSKFFAIVLSVFFGVFIVTFLAINVYIPAISFMLAGAGFYYYGCVYCKSRKNHVQNIDIPSGYDADSTSSNSTINNDFERAVIGYNNIAFHYIDGNGNSSYRKVHVTEFDGDTIQAFCTSAGAMRTFFLSRIDGGITLTDTGELVEPYEWANLVESHL